AAWLMGPPVPRCLVYNSVNYSWDKAIRAQDRIKDITFIDGICNDGSDKDEQGKE
ncbi:hypothetical protein GGI03_009067, partial [Coemansia sp. RSA 2337]